jgi:uncharacterized protein
VTRPVVHFQIRGRDPARLREFYSRLFGWDIADPNPVGASVIEPGIGGPEGVGGHIAQGDPPGVSIVVQVLDPHETIAQAESMGGKAVIQPFDVPDGPTVAQIADPEGNLIGLVK